MSLPKILPSFLVTEELFDPKSVPSTYSIKDNGTHLGTDHNVVPEVDKDLNRISASRKSSSSLRSSTRTSFDDNDQTTTTDMDRNSPTVCVTFHKTVERRSGYSINHKYTTTHQRGPGLLWICKLSRPFYAKI